jgi:protein-S-isoprenylcysteine O-methyltransferase Ste14
MATVVIPGAILYVTGVHSIAPILLAIGTVFLVMGLALLAATIRLFATLGEGTLAPWNPTQKLVVRGIYRHVRNPMISCVFLILIGDAIVFASLPLLGWAMFFIIVNMIYIPLVEEPGLVKRFGAEYEEYRRNVRRWVPRARGWGGTTPT